MSDQLQLLRELKQQIDAAILILEANLLVDCEPERLAEERRQLLASIDEDNWGRVGDFYIIHARSAAANLSAFEG